MINRKAEELSKSKGFPKNFDALIYVFETNSKGKNIESARDELFQILNLDDLDLGKVLVLVLNSPEMDLESAMMLSSVKKPWRFYVIPPDPDINNI